MKVVTYSPPVIEEDVALMINLSLLYVNRCHAAAKVRSLEAIVGVTNISRMTEPGSTVVGTFVEARRSVDCSIDPLVGRLTTVEYWFAPTKDVIDLGCCAFFRPPLRREVFPLRLCEGRFCFGCC